MRNHRSRCQNQSCFAAVPVEEVMVVEDLHANAVLQVVELATLLAVRAVSVLSLSKCAALNARMVVASVLALAVPLALRMG
jgi:hypothetical protein